MQDNNYKDTSLLSVHVCVCSHRFVLGTVPIRYPLGILQMPGSSGVEWIKDILVYSSDKAFSRPIVSMEYVPLRCFKH